MKFVLFYHSLISCWNYRNAHFLRGVASQLIERGHDVCVYEPINAHSVINLLNDHGMKPVREFYATYPTLRSTRYDPANIDLNQALGDADVVMVNEWDDHDLVRRIGEHRNARGKYRLLFHDTHHRSVTDPQSIEKYGLAHYDGVLAFGQSVARCYRDHSWCPRVWNWQEAADTRVFHPIKGHLKQWDLVWVGNWNDQERTQELREYLIEPVRKLHLSACVFGARYPAFALEALEAAGIEYGGYLPNFQVPHAFAQARLTVHVPRRPYVAALPGIPTIRPFEALACGIPMACAPWNDCEKLFSPGEDFLVARDGAQMQQHLCTLITEPDYAATVAARGRRTVLQRHTCRHRVDELLSILADMDASLASRIHPEPRRSA